MENESLYQLQEQLNAQYKYWWNIEFPMITKSDYSDELEDLYASLDLMDGYVAGIVSTYIKTGKYEFDISKYDCAFSQILQRVKKSNSMEKILNYKKEIDKLVWIFEKIVNKEFINKTVKNTEGNH